MQVIKLFGLILISLSALSGCVSTSVQNTNWEYKVVTVDYLNEKTKEFLEATPFKLERDDGMPIQSKDYSDIKNKFRPGHADLTYFLKYGIRDYRGGGRSSARETANRVAAGAVARKVIGHVLKKDILIQGAVTQVGKLTINQRNFNWNDVKKNSFFCPDKKIVKVWEEYLDETRKKGSSLGAKLLVNAKNVPAGLGEPVYGKLDADLAGAMMSINAVKGVEIGAGNEAVELSGDENSDEIRANKNKKIIFSSNNSGGILGGISSGQDLNLSITIKPTSSILKAKKTINNKFQNTSISTKGRHDPCVGLRAVPIAEAMMACVLADHILRNRAQCS